jgi:hypothetical protein
MARCTITFEDQDDGTYQSTIRFDPELVPAEAEGDYHATPAQAAGHAAYEEFLRVAKAGEAQAKAAQEPDGGDQA